MANNQAQFPGTVEQIEHTKNKVTEFRDSVTDGQYPSAKATKDALDKKANSADLYPVGTVYITKTADINLGELLGGTWNLIDKEFRSATRVDENAGKMFIKTSKIANYQVYALYGGHTIRLRLSFTPTVALSSDDTVEIGRLIMSELGLNGIYHSIIAISALGDGANGLVMTSINADGEVFVSDVVKSTIANQPLYINKEITCLQSKMLDSFCDKFYWERTE